MALNALDKWLPKQTPVTHMPFSLPALSCPPAAFSVGNSSGEKDNSRLEPLKPAKKTGRTYGARESSFSRSRRQQPRTRKPCCPEVGPSEGRSAALASVPALSKGSPEQTAAVPRQLTDRSWLQGQEVGRHGDSSPDAPQLLVGGVRSLWEPGGQTRAVFGRIGTRK